MHDAEVALAGRDQVDGVPRLALGERQREVGVGGAQVAYDGGDQPAHRGRERGQPQVPGDRPGPLVQPGLDLLEVGEQADAGVDQVPAVVGEDHAAADPLEQGDAGLLLQALDLLGDRARA